MLVVLVLTLVMPVTCSMAFCAFQEELFEAGTGHLSVIKQMYGVLPLLETGTPKRTDKEVS